MIARIHALADRIVGSRTNAELYGSLGAAAMLDDRLWIDDFVAEIRDIDDDTSGDALLEAQESALGLAGAASDLHIEGADEIARAARQIAEILGQMAVNGEDDEEPIERNGHPAWLAWYQEYPDEGAIVVYAADHNAAHLEGLRAFGEDEQDEPAEIVVEQAKPEILKERARAARIADRPAPGDNPAPAACSTGGRGTMSCVDDPLFLHP